MAAKKPVIAMMYDFDKTLCTTDMQAYTFIPNLGMSADEFWTKASKLAEEKKMDRILAYMYLMLDEAHVHRISIRRDDFVALGKDLKLYPGVKEWFCRINQFGKEQGVTVKHYIISSGLREIIEGSSIYKEFDDVFAGEFLYDENGVACWPKNVVNYTTKTQFLFRINKGVLDISKYLLKDARYTIFAAERGCYNSGPVTAKKEAAGGISGSMEFGIITDSVNTGAITVEEGGYCGGICGTSQGAVTKSCAGGLMNAETYTGGIAGIPLWIKSQRTSSGRWPAWRK